MDAVIVPKVLAGEEIIRETQASEPPTSDSSLFKRPEASNTGSCHKDYSALSRGLEGHARRYANKNLVSSFKCEGNGKTHNNIEVPPNEKKQLISKLKKNFSSSSGSKRPRTDQPECSMISVRADDCEKISRKFESGVRKCNSSEKTRVLKQKKILDAKRPDKKNIRTCGKTKYDSLALKPTLTGTDSMCARNNGLDLYNVTSHVDDPPLSELLNGSYKCPSLCPQKMKKTPLGSEDILLSVKEAIAILQAHGAKNGICKAKGLKCPPGLNSGLDKSADSDCKANCEEVTESSGKVQDSLQSDMKHSTLYQPKDLLKRLMLPPTPDMGVLISELNTPALSLHSTANISTLRGASLPPFPWCFSNNGSCKSSLDQGKSAPIRSTCQSRWIRIGSSSTSFGTGQSCFEFDMQNHQKVGNLVEDTKSPTPIEAVSFSDITTTKSVPITSSTGTCDEYKSQTCLFGKQGEGSDCQIKLESHDNAFHGSFQIQCASVCQGKTDSAFPGKDDKGTQRNHPVGSLRSSSSISCYLCACGVGGCSHGLHLSTSGTSKEDDSPRVMSAAKILYELSTSSIITSTRDHDIGEVKGMEEQSHNTLKVQKLISPFRKVEEACHVSRRRDPGQGVGLPSARHKLPSEKITSHMNGISSGPTRWPAHEGLSPNKSEKDLGFDKTLHNKSFKPTNFLSSSARAEQILDHQRRNRKMAIRNMPPSFREAHIKDWNRKMAIRNIPPSFREAH